MSSGIASPAHQWGTIGGYLLVIMCCRRRRCRRSCVRSRRVFVVDPCCYSRFKAKHLGDHQVMFFKSNIITQPKLPVRLYFFSGRRRVHFHWHRTTTTVRETNYGSVFQRKYQQPTAHIALPRLEPLENLINDPNQAKKDFAEHDKDDGDEKINDTGSCS